MPGQLMWKCPGCNNVTRIPANAAPIRCWCGFVQYHNPPGLGDRVAATLARLGITEHRYNKARRALGIKKPCGCKKRQQKLNRIGKAVNDGD